MLARAHTFTRRRTSHAPRHRRGRRATRAARVRDRRPGRTPPCARRASACARRSSTPGFEFPARRITANLAPGRLPKAGPGLDLALACALLAATGQLPREPLESHALLGELALDGARAARPGHARGRARRPPRRPAHARARGRSRRARRRSWTGLEVAVVERLQSAVRVLRGGRGDPLPAPRIAHAAGGRDAVSGADLGEVRGQHHAVRSLVIAAAGGHNLLLSGAPGTGKTMLAQRRAVDPAAADGERGDRGAR